jgi:uncharacterized protein YdeI (YjbR/CyaY-like superfamily)
MNPKVDFFFEKESKWQKEYQQMRAIALDCGLDEDLKWGQPCYTRNDKNIVLIHGFKEYCAYLFFKGALLKDDEHILVQQTEHVQSPRQVRFTNVKEIVKLQKTLKAYIYEAIEVEKAGLKVNPKNTSDYEVAEEFQKKLNEDKTLKTAFKALTPGRQRGYLFYFSQPKQSKTREARIEKCIPAILAGKGLND